MQVLRFGRLNYYVVVIVVLVFLSFFFFQAEDGIRDLTVTGVQTCALPILIWSEGSDSASLDNALELLVRSGRDPVHALVMLVPEAHEGAVEMEPALRGFYEFHECLVEPWDGPAALAFSDGVIVGSALDRNGRRRDGRRGGVGATPRAPRRPRASRPAYTRTCASASRRSRTRRSTRCARHW